MAMILHLRCPICDRRYHVDEVQYTCPVCGPVGTLDVLYDYAQLQRDVSRTQIEQSDEHSMWRYRALLPLNPGSRVPPLRVGMTPLYRTDRLAEQLGLRDLWLKDDGQNPTGSFKDRASAMVIARAMELGIDTVSTASTGNAAAALAGIGASVGMKTIIFVPAAAPEAKIAQLLVYGAIVLLVQDTYDVAFELCATMCAEVGWYCRNTAMNPFTTEGKKTAAYEIAEQFGWQVPDVVMVGVGDGNIIAGLHKGFYDLHEMGWIARIPRLIGVQAAGSSALVHAWQHNIAAQDMQPMPVETIADSISAGVPRDRAKALRAVRQTNGAFIAVPDNEILAAIPEVARWTGVFVEPSCAVVYAGAKRAVESGLVQRDEQVLFMMTGNGLKDIRRAQQSVGGGLQVQPTIAAVRDALGTR
jgi:threonine synthase